MIAARQKFLLHHYARVAGLSDEEYRVILSETVGVRSSTAPAFGQAGFDRVMARLEEALCERVAAGVITDPIGRDRWITTRDYWRRRCPSATRLSTRQAARIRELWGAAQESLPPAARTLGYLRGVMERATGRQDIGTRGLSPREAAQVIDALQALSSRDLCHKTPA